MEPYRPLDILASRPIVRMLRYLVTQGGSHTGRHLASAAHVTQGRAVEALATLTRLGVVHRRRAGRAYLFSLNEPNYLTSDIIIPAFRHEGEWLTHLGEEVLQATNGAGESVVLHGSWARGEASERSDVDLLLVVRDRQSRDRARHRGEELRGHLADRFGRPVSFLVFSRDEIRSRLRRGDRLLRSIVREGRPLAGKTLAELARRA